MRVRISATHLAQRLIFVTKFTGTIRELVGVPLRPVSFRRFVGKAFDTPGCVDPGREGFAIQPLRWKDARPNLRQVYRYS